MLIIAEIGINHNSDLKVAGISSALPRMPARTQ